MFYFCLGLPFFTDARMPKWRMLRTKVFILKQKRPEKEAVTDEDEELFSRKGLLGCGIVSFEFCLLFQWKNFRIEGKWA